MNLEKWIETKNKILDNFDVSNQDTLQDEDKHGIKEIIEFKGPMGDIKLEMNIRDLILSKHSNYSNRIGSDMSVDYEYSDTEKTYRLKVYQKEGDEWQEMEQEHQPFVF
ncbi:hypothetical protein K8R66_01560 [bacterium]|nr:hypothetical protein [bacterium]